MSNLVKNTQLKEIVTQIWTKSKDRFAKLNEDNYFTGINAFNNLNMLKSKNSIDYSSSTTLNRYQGRWTGLRCLNTSQLEDGYLYKIRIYVSDGLTSSTFSGINIFPVTHKAGLGTDIVTDNIATESSYKIVDEGSGIKYFDVHVNKKYSENTYFIIGAEDSNDKKLRSCANAKTEYQNDVVHLNSAPSVQTGITGNRAEKWYLKYELYGRDNVSTAISNIQIELNNRVHNNKLTSIGGTGHQEKVPQLNGQGKLDVSFLPDLPINHISVVDNEVDAENLITQQRIKTGDLVIVRGNNNEIYMYNGQTSGGFSDKFIHLAMNTGGISTINDEAGQGGNVTLGLEFNVDNLEFKVESRIVKSLECYSDNDVTEFLRTIN